MQKFRKSMDVAFPDWEMAIVLYKINLYYLTGTIQDGMLVIPRADDAVLFVRRSYERAMDESSFPLIRPMNSYRDAAAYFKSIPSTVYLETEIVPMAMYQRLQKYFPFTSANSIDTLITKLRSVKSPYELDLMKKSGIIHARVLEELVPGMLKEGMSELELFAELYSTMLREGHHGMSRFGMFDIEEVLGHVAIGESSIYPTKFNGPGGNYGMSPAVPLIGSREKKLSIGDLVFIDVGCGVDGYHTDKTLTYMFGKPIPEHAIKAHQKCLDIQYTIAGMLKPGAIPSKIYNEVMGSLDEEFLEDFMGFGNRKVKFLGHGTGLLIDELPVIANGFDEPLQEGMVFALEPKKGIKNVGMVGIENTFLVTPEGGQCLTGESKGMILV
jgi:Xaa-Pro aminopeptidase